MHKGFSLTEMLISLAIISIISLLTIPVITKKYGTESYSAACVIKKLASSVSLPMNEATYTAMSDSDPCKNAVDLCRNSQSKACTNLISYSYYGKVNPDERSAARKVLRAACDLGGKEACKFFITSCQKDKSRCNMPDDYDLNYYLTLPASTPPIGFLSLKDQINKLFISGYNNVSNAMQNNCCKSSQSFACTLRNATSCGWSKNFGGYSDDYGWAMAMDNTGIYVTGENETATVLGDNYYEVHVVKLDINTGAVLWKKMFGGNKDEGAYGITVDKTGVYVTGTERSSPIPGQSSGGLFVMKLNPNNGSPIWKKVYGNTGAYAGQAITVDDQGIYVTGRNYYYDSGIRSTMFAMKINKDTGTAIWKKSFGSGAISKEAEGMGITIDIAGVYIIGSLKDETNVAGSTNPDALVMKLNKSNGSVIWKKKFGGSGTEKGKGITSDKSGIYVTGVEATDTASGGTADDIFVMKINPDNGATVWKKQYGGSDYDTGEEIIADGSGLYITGDEYSIPPPNNYTELFVMKLNPNNGEVIWKRRFGGDSHEVGYGIAVRNNEVYVTGEQFSNTNAGNTNCPDMFVIKLTGDQENNLDTTFDGYDLNTYFNGYDITNTYYNGADLDTYFIGYDLNTYFNGYDITNTYYNGYNLDPTKFSGL